MILLKKMSDLGILNEKFGTTFTVLLQVKS